MALQNFVNFVGPAISAAWLNAVDVIKTTILGDAVTKADARTALTSDAPLEVVNGGTGVRSVPELVDLIGGDISLPSQTGHAYARLFTDGTNAAWEKSSVYHVNDFGAVGDNVSHPLSERFATLGDAQAVYPCATSLSDEIDWCAWQTCVYAVYQRDYNAVSNVSSGKIIADGCYVVNKSIHVPLYQVTIEGQTQASNVTLGTVTTIRYNGPSATVDDPIAVIDFYPTDEQGDPAPGYPPTVGGSAGYCRIYNMGFHGNSGSMLGTAPSASGFIQGIRLRYCNFGEVARCSFYGNLYDGIVVGLSMFTTIRNNFFYGCHRDGLAFYAIKGNFSTTAWIEDNEFGAFGRYGFFIDVSGSVQPSIVIRRNDVEGVIGNSYYIAHPEWFVQGVVASCCLIGVGMPGASFIENRFEGITFYDGVWADLHLCNSGYLLMDNNAVWGTVVTGTAASQMRTSVGITFINARGYYDVTDTRNYRLGVTGDIGAVPQGLSIKNSFGGVFFFADGQGFGSSDLSSIENQMLFQLSVPPVDRPDMDGKMFGPAQTSVPTIQPISNVHLRRVNVTAGYGLLGTVFFDNFHTSSAHGSYTIQGLVFNAWSAGQACRADCNPNGGGGALGHWLSRRKWVRPTVYNSYYYECIVSGTTGGVEPTWPTTIGNTVVDGGVTWKCIGRYTLSTSWSTREYMEVGRRHVTVDNAPPTAGYWSGGEVAINRFSLDGYTLKWICSGAGIPGSWIAYEWAATSAPTSISLADTATIVQSSGGAAKKATVQKLKDVVYLKPINSQSGNYTLVALDSGQTVLHPSGAGAGHTFTIPANSSVSYPLGVELEIINEDSNALSIAITSDTMTLEGSTTTGTRTLGQNGRARARKTSATTWLITGTALT